MKSLFVSFWLFAASEPSAPRGQSRGDTPPETTMSDENDDEFEDNMNQMVHTLYFTCFSTPKNSTILL